MNLATRGAVQRELNRKRIELEDAKNKLFGTEQLYKQQRKWVDHLTREIDELRQDLEAVDGVLA